MEVMNSKDHILSAVRGARPAGVELPAFDAAPWADAWTRYDDPRAAFIKMLTLVGGRAEVVRGAAELNERLRAMPVCIEAEQICSCVSDVDVANVDLAAIDDPHELADLDLAVLPGEFAVAENGAIWVTDEHVPHRVAYFIAQHLVLVVPAGAIVDHMHDAYRRLGDEQALSQPRFGAFISGPSKTADIEQSLVVGAHGARSLTVFLIE